MHGKKCKTYNSADQHPEENEKLFIIQISPKEKKRKAIWYSNNDGSGIIITYNRTVKLFV